MGNNKVINELLLWFIWGIVKGRPKCVSHSIKILFPQCRRLVKSPLNMKCKIKVIVSFDDHNQANPLTLT